MSIGRAYAVAALLQTGCRSRLLPVFIVLRWYRCRRSLCISCAGAGAHCIHSVPGHIQSPVPVQALIVHLPCRCRRSLHSLCFRCPVTFNS